MAYYENVFIARQDIASAQVESLTEEFEKLITDQGGKVSKKENWGLRSLAYRMNKNRKGHYVLMNIEAEGPVIHELERQMRLHEDVLRYLTVKVEELDESPSPMMAKGGDRRDGRGPRGDRGDRGPRGDRGDRPERGDRGDRPERGDRSEKPAEDAGDTAEAASS